MIHLDYRDARPIYTQIVDNFQGQITAGVLAAGEKIPSVRELASQLTINPNTIQRAYRELEMGGWIASVPGKGSFVCGVPDSSQQEQLALLKKLDGVVQALVSMGCTREELADRIRRGGNENA